MSTLISSLAEIHTLATAGFVVSLVVKSTLIVGFAGIINAVLSRAPAALRHGLWSAVFLFILVLPFISRIQPVFNIPILPVSAETLTGPNSASVANAESKLPGNNLVTASVSSETVPSVYRTSGSNLKAWLIILWLIGVLFIVSKLLLEILSLNVIAWRTRLKTPLAIRGTLDSLRTRLKIYRNIRISCVDKIRIPMTFGLLRPTVLLPASAVNWPHERIQTVLCHELAHIKRWDYLTNLLGLGVCAIYWFNPLVWIAVRQFYIERERASDDFVLRQGTENTDYAEQLLKIARPLAGHHHNPGRHVLAMATGSQLKKRMQHILSPHTQRSSLNLLSAAAICLVLTLIVTPMVFIDLNARPESDNSLSREQPDDTNSQIGQLIQSLKNPDPAIRTAAALELGTKKAESAVESLLDILDDMRPEVRIAALTAIGKIGKKDSFYRSVQMLKDTNPSVRVAALHALKGIGCDPAFVAVTYSLTDPSPQVRSEAAKILRLFIHKPLKTPVMQVLANYSQFFVTFLPETLGEIQNLTAIEYLENAGRDPYPMVKNEVEKTLKSIRTN